MAFPGELNINYYKGDTYEFNIYPKKADGTVFNLSEYNNSYFWINTARDAGNTGKVECLSTISDNGEYVKCVITPAQGETLTSGVSYVYDVQVKKTGGDYPLIYTLLTGNITVTGQGVKES